jgi:hypothetical protein
VFSSHSPRFGCICPEVFGRSAPNPGRSMSGRVRRIRVSRTGSA